MDKVTKQNECCRKMHHVWPLNSNRPPTPTLPKLGSTAESATHA